MKRKIFAVSSVLLLSLLILAGYRVSQATDATQPAATIAPTVDAALYDFASAKWYKSEKDIFEIQLPAAWTSTAQIAQPGDLGSTFVFSSDASPTPLAQIQFQLIDASMLYAAVDPSGTVNSPQALIQTFVDASAPQAGQPAPKISAVTIGKFAGQGIHATIPASAQDPEIQYYIYVAPLDARTLIYMTASADSTVASLAMPLFDKMLATVVVNAANIPPPAPNAPDGTPTS